MLISKAIRYARHLGLTTSLVGIHLAACSEAAPAGPRPAESSPGESPAFFAAAVRYFVARGEGPLRVDPRPLRPEARLHSVTERDLLPGTPEIVRMRTAVLEREGWDAADAVADWKCVFAEGYPPARPPASEPADSMRLRHEECRRNGRFQSLILGIPQAGTDPGHPHRWRIRTMRMLLHGYEGVDLFLERSASGDWNVVDARDRTGVFS